MQQPTACFWQAEARSGETKQCIRGTKRLTHSKFSAEGKIRIALEGFRRHTPIFAPCASRKTSSGAPTTPVSKVS